MPRWGGTGGVGRSVTVTPTKFWKVVGFRLGTILSDIKFTSIFCSFIHILTQKCDITPLRHPPPPPSATPVRWTLTGEYRVMRYSMMPGAYRFRHLATEL